MSKKYKYQNPQVIYFSTCTVMGWVDVFTKDIYRDVIIDSLRYCRKHKGLEVIGYVIMSNHIHLLIRSEGKNLLSETMRDFKRHTARQIMLRIESDLSFGYESRKNWMLRLFSFYGMRKGNTPKYHFWQEGDHPKEIQDEDMLYQKLEYIHLTPVRGGWVCQPEDFRYSSAGYYQGFVSDILEVRAV